MITIPEYISSKMTAADTWKKVIEFMIGRGNIDALMIVSSENGALWASSDPENFYLREYPATITQEDGSEREEVVNEANNLMSFIKGQKPAQGLRINGKKKEQVTRSFKDEDSGLQVLFTKIPQGGSCVAHAGKCVIIGTFSEAKGHSSPQCNETVTLMAAYYAKSTWPNRSDGEPAGGAGPVSWQVYVDTLMVGKGNVAQAMIIAAADGKILASTEKFELKKYEAEIAQEDGTDKTETVDEIPNILKVIFLEPVLYVLGAAGMTATLMVFVVVRSY
ncbi:MAG: profilin family protein [Burkholderiaceae bacterium]